MNQIKFVNFNMLYLKFIYFIRFFADSLFGTFTVLYLANIGLKEGIIGTINSITTITILIANPIWMLVAKNNKIRHWLLVLLCIFQGIFISIYGNISDVVMIMILTALMAISSGPYYNLLESYGVSFCEECGSNYSSLRVMGTIAAFCAVPIGGYLANLIGYRNLFFISGGLFIITGLSSILLNDKKADIDNKEKRSFKFILSNRSFLIYASMYILITIANSIAVVYTPLIFTKIKGLSTAEYSYIISFKIFLEAVILILAPKILKKATAKKIIAIGGLSLVIGNVILSFAGDLSIEFLAAATMGNAIWSGFMGYFNMKYLLKIVGVNNIASASLFISIVSSILNFIMANCFGYLIESFGYNIIYLILSSFILLGVIGFGLLTYIFNEEKR